jgi:hypothetical protein
MADGGGYVYRDPARLSPARRAELTERDIPSPPPLPSLKGECTFCGATDKPLKRTHRHSLELVCINRGACLDRGWKGA